MDILKEKEGVRDWYNLIVENFDKRYEGIEAFYWENFESKIVNELIDVKNKVVLDLGCGGGRYALSVCKRAKQVIGIDISDKMIEIARKKLTPDMSIKFLVGDATCIPFKNEHFDVIVSLGMFEYLKDPTPFLSEINRILKKDGILLFVCHNRNYGCRFLRKTKFFQQVIKPTLKPIKNYLSVIDKATDYYGSSLEIRAKYWRAVRHDLREIDKFLKLNGLKLLKFRSYAFKIPDMIFKVGRKTLNTKLRNSLLVSSAFINRFQGKFTLTKNCGGNLIIKAKKVGGK